jgi:nitroreductase
VSDFDLAQTDRLLTTTRAVRKRLDLTRPVPRQVVLECLDVAIQAPTGGNVQQWRWLVLDDPAIKAGIAELYQRAYAPYIDSQKTRVAEVGRTDTSTSNIIDSSAYLAEHLAQVPVHVIPCALGRLTGQERSGQVSGWYGSILPAVWSFQLALRARGLGSAWTTLHLDYEAEAAELLGIPDTVTQVALLPVAYTIGTDFKPAVRKPAGEVTYWNSWRSKA